MEYNSVSTNILRDESRVFDYITTPNTIAIFDKIFITKGASRSFSLIGNYGTGKSSFLWALEKNIKGEKNYFKSVDSIVGDFTFVKVVGSTVLLSEALKSKFNLSSEVSNDELIEVIAKLFKSLHVKNKRLVFIIDEFGKFLESAAKHSKLEELYLLQQLAELVNDEVYGSYLIVTLHQNFNDYGVALSASDKREWEKVKGRFTELTFNEPVEQLIYFASKKLKVYNLPDKLGDKYHQLVTLVNNSKLVFTTSEAKNTDISDLYPLDWLSIHVLVNSLQRYGQNERSLFTFLSDTSRYSITNFKKDFYSVADVYDYLVNNLSSEIYSKGNPHRGQWKVTFEALEKVELYYQNSNEDFEIATEVVKTISLVNLFSRSFGKFDRDFINSYFELTRGKSVYHILDKLEKTGVIRFYRYSNKINFLEGTDIDIEYELLNVQSEVNHLFLLSEEVLKRISLPVFLAKRISIQTGTNRFFETQIINSSKELKGSEGVIDGFISLIFDEFSLTSAKHVSKQFDDHLFVYYKKLEEIREEVIKILQYELLIKKFNDDQKALKVLRSDLNYHEKTLEELVLLNLFDKENNVWLYKGREVAIDNQSSLYTFLSTICEHDLYTKTPVLRNELFNKEYLSTPINTARKALFKRLLSNANEKDLGYDDKRFPPDKAIYISLLRKTGIHQFNKVVQSYELSEPINESPLYGLWKDSETFLKSSSLTKRGLNEFYDFLKAKPYKLKSGFIDFWIPIFLIAHQDDVALFHEKTGFVPYLDGDVIDILHKNASDFYVKFYDVSGLKINILESYKELTQLGNADFKGTKNAFLSIFANFLGFVRNLNTYTLKTKKVSEITQKFRVAIEEAKDPEDALFNLFPAALGYHSLMIKEDEKALESFVEQLKMSIRELRQAYGDLLERIESYLLSSFYCEHDDFLAYKEEIQGKLSSVNVVLLSTEQKHFYQRLVSPLDDRESWIKSVADVVLGKSISELLDVEESILENKIKDLSLGLIKASEIHSYNAHSGNEELFAMRIFEASGDYKDLKFVSTTNKTQHYTKAKASIETLINNLDKETRSSLLYELLSKELD